MNTNNIKRSIRSSEIISFDLFDTLFFRPYYKPSDIFDHLEIIQAIPGFKNQRILAERIARSNSEFEEVTIDEIYQNIASEFSHMKEKEMGLEFRSVSINSEVKNLFNYY